MIFIAYVCNCRREKYIKDTNSLLILSLIHLKIVNLYIESIYMFYSLLVI